MNDTCDLPELYIGSIFMLQHSICFMLINKAFKENKKIMTNI